MSITFGRAYLCGGNTFATLEDAQRFELAAIFSDGHPQPSAFTADDVAAAIIANREKVMDILTLTDNSRPRGRKSNGGTKRRKKGEEQQTLPGTEQTAA